MSEYPKMLYKWPGIEEIHGDKFDYTIVEDEEAEDVAKEDGWFLTTDEAKGKKEAEDAAKNDGWK